MSQIEAEREALSALAQVAENVASSARAVMDDLARARVEDGVIVLPDGALKRRYGLHDLVQLVGPIAELAQAM